MFLILLALGALAGCGGSGEEGNNEALGDSAPLSPEEADSVTIRVSGTEGTAFLGDYGSFTGEWQAIDGTLEAEPTDYEVGGDFSRGVTAFFRKTEHGGEKLKVEILATLRPSWRARPTRISEASLVWLAPSQDLAPLPEDLPEGDVPTPDSGSQFS